MQRDWIGSFTTPVIQEWFTAAVCLDSLTAARGLFRGRQVFQLLQSNWSRRQDQTEGAANPRTGFPGILYEVRVLSFLKLCFFFFPATWRLGMVVAYFLEEAEPLHFDVLAVDNNSVGG